MSKHGNVALSHTETGALRDIERYILHYQGTLIGYLERLLKDRLKAEDLAQETFIRLFRQLQRERIPENVPAWLYQVATNLCRDYWRSAGYKREIRMLQALPDQKDKQARVVDIFVRRETRTEMLTLIERLPKAQQLIIKLRFYHDMRLKEIAETLNCPIGTVKSRLFHALRFLREQIEDIGE
ncbi:hypothetical protein GCM10011391_06760 [Pullulanibacillus camelliae]|uniref:Sigma-70 family RNA polymerase sigma factor n=1 Tax=Pullulanibacillus camelliae TaxID=1707096 RepID=A0A8J2YB05_9BACL|nr:RNA polymerase sigma factor [Pullulanibacillus camelliae]GGE30793.1 hypothetical protein GCM10011391_06760 [Pullulanibacillus camelliae]